jgi:hypothetical protein
MQQGNISGRFLEMGQLQPTPTNRQQLTSFNNSISTIMGIS